MRDESQKYLESIATLEKENFHFLENDSLAIEMEFARLMMNSVKRLKPEKIVEIGTGFGYSTSWLMLGIENPTELWTFDTENRIPKIFDAIKYSINQLTLIQTVGDYKNLLKSGYLNNIDFLFHDSEHRIEKITSDLDVLIGKMSKKSEIWIHDTHGQVGKELADYFKNKGGWDYVQNDISWGLGIAINYDNDRSFYRI